MTYESHANGKRWTQPKRLIKLLTTFIIFAGILAALILYEKTTWQDHRVEAELTPSAIQVAREINEFSLDLYKSALTPNANLLISPASVSLAVGLSYRGARGSTADELRSVMHYEASPKDHLAAEASLLRSLNIQQKSRSLHLAASLWADRELPLRTDFATDISASIESGIQRVSFKNNPEAARKSINQWVASKTNDRITDLLEPRDVTNETRSVLVQSIYWKGDWKNKFAYTENGPFTSINGKKIEVPLMHRDGSFKLAEYDGVKVIELPYRYDELSLIVLLPETSSALPTLEARLTPEKLQQWVDGLDATGETSVIVTFPKLHLEWRGDLVPQLQMLGAKMAFSDGADFSNMLIESAASDKSNGLKIGVIIHKTWLELDEHSTEAAAASGILHVMTSSFQEREHREFRADKPFLFLLRDRRSNLILFMGRYVAPQGREWVAPAQPASTEVELQGQPVVGEEGL